MDIIDKKLENVIKNFIALCKYDNLFFKVGDNEEEEKKLFNRLIMDDASLFDCNALFLINNIIRIKEDVVDKIGYGNIEEKAFLKGKDVMSSFNHDDPSYKFVLGNFKTNSFAEYISKIRNKLAHGDYYLDEGSCYLNIENKDVYIPSDLFLFLNKYLTTSNNYYKKEYKFQKNIIVNAASKVKIDQINEDNLDSILPLYNVLYINIVSFEKDKEIKEEIKDEFVNDTEYLNEVLNATDKRDFKLWQSKMIEKYNKLGVSLSFESLKIKDPKLLNLIKEYVSNNPFFQIQDSIIQKMMLGDLIEKFYYFNYNEKFILTGNVLNVMQTNNLIHGKRTYKYEDFIVDRAKIVCGDYLEQLTSILLAKFHTLYTCLLDDVLKKNEEYRIDRSEEFDFSLLNLDDILPNVLVISNNYLDSLSLQIPSVKNNIANAKSEIDKKNTCLTNLVDKNYPQDKIDKISSIIESLMPKIILLEEKLSNLQYELLSVTNDLEVNKKHFENKAVIEGIRNSISHGNFTIKMDSIIDVNVETCFINFKDYDKNDKIVFDLDISLRRFSTLFCEENSRAIETFVKAKIEERKIVGIQYTL